MINVNVKVVMLMLKVCRGIIVLNSIQQNTHSNTFIVVAGITVNFYT